MILIVKASVNHAKTAMEFAVRCLAAFYIPIAICFLPLMSIARVNLIHARTAMTIAISFSVVF